MQNRPFRLGGAFAAALLLAAFSPRLTGQVSKNTPPLAPLAEPKPLVPKGTPPDFILLATGDVSGLLEPCG